MKTEVAGLLDEQVREAYPVLKDVVYLNVGTYGIMPRPAFEKFQEIQADLETRGVANTGRKWGRHTEGTRERIAQLVGAASADEIAFTRNATDGINLVLAGLDWAAGDEVITTEEEHEAMNHPLSYLHTHRGLNFKRLVVSPVAEVMIERLNEAYSDRTRLVAMSFVTCETGTRLPVKAICQWAKEHNLLSLLDGAQVSGAIKIDVQDIGCDYYTSNGHKWLSGPKGTGFFYGRKDKLELLSPAHVGAGSLEKVDVETGYAEPNHNGQRFEFGTRAWPGQAGLGAALDWFEELGWDNVYRHIEVLSDYLKARIKERPYLKLLTPMAFEQSSGLTSFEILEHNAGEVAQQLREKKNIYTRVVPHFNCMRIATAHFVNANDIDVLMASLDEICG